MKLLSLLFLIVATVNAEDAIIGRSGSTLRNDYTGSVGMRFSIAEPITITHLSRWVVAGSSNTHTLWLATETATLVSVQLPVGPSSTGFVYASIQPELRLPSGTYYLFSDERIGGDRWYHSSDAITAHPKVTVISAAHAGSPSQRINTDAGKCYGPVSFVFTATSVVPEPIDWKTTILWDDPNPTNAVQFWTVYASNNVAVKSVRSFSRSIAADALLHSSSKDNYWIFGTASNTNETSPRGEMWYVNWTPAKLKGPDKFRRE